ncbi:MAG: hypothetical protein WKF87_10245 [Chryseolinea sp.]
MKDVAAYNLDLKGLHALNKQTQEDSRQAISHFQDAIAHEPSYAQAHAMIAGTYNFLGSSGQMLPKIAYELVHKHADFALQLDPTIAEGHIAKAAAYLLYEWKWERRAKHWKNRYYLIQQPPITYWHTITK